MRARASWPVDWSAPGRIDEAVEIAKAAEAEDGYPPFNDQMLVEMERGGARVGLVRSRSATRVVGACAVDGPTVEFVVHPDSRRTGVGSAIAEAALARAARDRTEPAAAWAHGTLPGAEAIAARLGLAPSRRIHVLGRGLPPDAPTPRAAPDGVRLRTAAAGVDVDEWVRLNAAAFANIPDQRRLTAEDFLARSREEWFDPAGLILAGTAAGPVGYCWTKIVSIGGHRVGEIYAIGVVPEARALGIGGALLDAGIAEIRRRGAGEAILYVDADNAAAIAVYSSRGFARRSTDTRFTMGG